MSEKSVLEIQTVIQILERKIPQLKDQLKRKNTDLKRHKKMLKLARLLEE